MFDIIKDSSKKFVDGISRFYIFLDREYTLNDFICEALENREKGITRFTLSAKGMLVLPSALFIDSNLRCSEHTQSFVWNLDRKVINARAEDDGREMKYIIEMNSIDS